MSVKVEPFGRYIRCDYHITIQCSQDQKYWFAGVNMCGFPLCTPHGTMASCYCPNNFEEAVSRFNINSARSVCVVFDKFVNPQSYGCFAFSFLNHLKKETKLWFEAPKENMEVLEDQLITLAEEGGMP